MGTKEERIQIRVSPEIKEKFAIVADHRGLQTSSLLHSLIIKTIREEETEFPFLFKPKIGRMMTEIELVSDQKDLKKTG